jgi:hypothetical protein
VWELRDWLVGQWRAKDLALTHGSPTGALGAATSDVAETMSCTELVGWRAEVDRLAAVVCELEDFARRGGLLIIVGVPEPTTIELVQSDLVERGLVPAATLDDGTQITENRWSTTRLSPT